MLHWKVFNGLYCITTLCNALIFHNHFINVCLIFLQLLYIFCSWLVTPWLMLQIQTRWWSQIGLSKNGNWKSRLVYNTLLLPSGSKNVWGGTHIDQAISSARRRRVHHHRQERSGWWLTLSTLKNLWLLQGSFVRTLALPWWLFFPWFSWEMATYAVLQLQTQPVLLHGIIFSAALTRKTIPVCTHVTFHNAAVEHFKFFLACSHILYKRFSFLRVFLPWEFLPLQFLTK